MISSSVPVPTILSGVDYIHADHDLAITSSDGADTAAHQVVMSCSSPLFNKLIKVEFTLRKTVNRIHLKYTSYETLKVVFGFAYNGTITVTESDNIEKLIGEVDYLNVKGVYDFLAQRLLNSGARIIIP